MVFVEGLGDAGIRYEIPQRRDVRLFLAETAYGEPIWDTGRAGSTKVRAGRR